MNEIPVDEHLRFARFQARRTGRTTAMLYGVLEYAHAHPERSVLVYCSDSRAAEAMQRELNNLTHGIPMRNVRFESVQSARLRQRSDVVVLYDHAAVEAMLAQVLEHNAELVKAVRMHEQRGWFT